MENNSAEKYIQLDQFLKMLGVVSSGGEAKHLIRSEVVLVNNAIETRRGRKLRSGDQVSIAEQTWSVTSEQLS